MSHGSQSSTLKDGVIDFTAGSLGGVALVYVGQPLDTVKVKMQTFPTMYKNMFDCIKQTVVKEGFFKGLYAGTVPAIAANVAENSVLFAAYGGCQKCMTYLTKTEKIEDLSVVSNATAGFLAAFFSSFTLCPTELVKCRLQAAREVQLADGQTAAKIGPFRLTQTILQQDGIRGLFRGLDSTLAREMPGYFVFFGGYELTRTLLAPPGRSKDECGPLATMAAGAIGGIAFWSFIFPFDVVKSRVQISNTHVNLFHMCATIFRNEGILALYNGLWPTILRTIPATATLFLTYETTKKVLHNLTEDPSVAV